MQKALQNLSKEELIALFQRKEKETKKAHQRILDLEFLLAQYKRIVHGQKRERFEGDANQMQLPFEADPQKVQQQEVEVKEKLSRSEEHTSELQSRENLVCRLLL